LKGEVLEGELAVAAAEEGRSRRRWSRRAITELRLCPDQRRQINHLVAGRSFGEGQVNVRPRAISFSAEGDS